MVRNEVELEVLTGSLTEVVAAAVQPQSLGLWIKTPQLAIPDPEAWVVDGVPLAQGVQEPPPRKV